MLLSVSWLAWWSCHVANDKSAPRGGQHVARRRHSVPLCGELSPRELEMTPAYSRCKKITKTVEKSGKRTPEEQPGNGGHLQCSYRGQLRAQPGRCRAYKAGAYSTGDLMQATVSSAGTADSYALLLLLQHQVENGRVIRHFVCSECMGMVEAVQGQGYLHNCNGGDHYADGIRLPPGRFNGVSG